MRVSLKAIAKKIGVTEATVSMALRNTGSISAKRRKQILDAARELNYVPNFVARGLSTGKSHLVGLVTATSFVEVTASLMDNFERAIRNHNYQVIGTFHQGLQHLEEKNMRDLVGRRADGVVGFPASGTNCAAWNILRDAKIPFVIFNESAPFPHNHVQVDIEDGARQMVEHLIQVGRRRLAFICTGSNSTAVQARLRGWRKACEAHGLEFDALPVFSSPASGTNELLQKLALQLAHCSVPVDGIAAGNDMIAIAVLQALHRRGVRVPEDMAVIGFDDCRVAGILPLPLSSIRQPIVEAASHAVEILLRHIANPEAKFEHAILKPKLVPRETTGMI